MLKQVIFDKKNVLVAGGAGFIGSHLCDELLKTSKVICVDNFVSGTERNIDHLLSSPDFAFINHDLSQKLILENQPSLEKFKIEFQGIQEIYNLACPMSPRKFLTNRSAIIAANSIVIRNVLDLAVKHQAKFLHFSSSVVYGPRRANQRDLKVMENDIGVVDHLSERGVYDEGKRFAETIVNNYRSMYQLDAKIARLFRTYGPRMLANDDQMIPDYVSQALDGKELVVAGGPDFSSSFCYIDDMIDGVVKLMNSKLSGPINIGSDVDVKLVDLVNIIIKETDSSSEINFRDQQLFYSELILPDTHQARNVLGWMPIVTLENGLRKTVFDIKAHKKLQGFGS